MTFEFIPCFAFLDLPPVSERASPHGKPERRHVLREYKESAFGRTLAVARCGAYCDRDAAIRLAWEADGDAVGPERCFDCDYLLRLEEKAKAW
jgi:hypothetical protein